MTAREWSRLVERARAEGLLPAETRVDEPEQRPWPVVLLTALGAWLAALPLMGVVGLLIDGLMQVSFGAYLAGVLLLALAVVLLRKPGVPLFVEQLAVPVLLAGAGSLAMGLARDLPPRGAAAVLAVVALGLAALVARPWLRVLLGAAAAGCLSVALAWAADGVPAGDSTARSWWALHGVLGLGFAAAWSQERALGQRAGAIWATALESTLSGWLLGSLAGLSLLAGMSFLVGGVLQPGGSIIDLGGRATPGAQASQAGSALLAALAAAFAARAWPGLRRVALGGVAAVLVGLAWFMPSLGGVLAVLAWAACTRRLGLAGAAAFASAWVIGAFYYRLAWPLADKALLLLAAGAALAALAWGLHRGTASAAAPRPAAGPVPHQGWVRAGIALTAVATLAAANLGIRDKEDLIARGTPVFVELAPVDPRSLMAGDFMRLAFRLPDEARNGDLPLLDGAVRPQVVARRDARGVATLARLQHANTPLADGEFTIELTPKHGGWILVTDAWYFREGDGERWAQARYGEFRVAPDGRALLVGMADGDLKPMLP